MQILLKKIMKFLYILSTKDVIYIVLKDLHLINSFFIIRKSYVKTLKILIFKKLKVKDRSGYLLLYVIIKQNITKQKNKKKP